MPIIEDNLVEIPKETWSDIINEKGYNEKILFTSTEL